MRLLHKMFKPAVCCAFALLALVGCAGGPKFAGKWKGEVWPAPGTTTESAGYKNYSKIVSEGKMDLKADHTFNAQFEFTIDGTWSESGNGVKLVIKKYAGQPVESLPKNQKPPGPLEMQLVAGTGPDGETLTYTPPNKMALLVFKPE